MRTRAFASLFFGGVSVARGLVLQADAEEERSEGAPVVEPYPDCAAVLGQTEGRSHDPRLRIVATLATTGTAERLQFVKRTLDSLNAQTVKLDRIILTFPDVFARRNETVKIPPEVEQWKRDIPSLYVQQMRDYGPGSKLLGGLKVEQDPDTILIVIDDDVRYHPRVVEQLACYIEWKVLQKGKDVAPCYAAEKSCSTIHGKKFLSSKGPVLGYARGVGGVAYRVRFFSKSIWAWAETMPKACFINDDVWIGGAMYNATKVRPFLLRGSDHGFHSVQEHGSCSGEACGFTTNSSTYANNKAIKFNHTDLKQQCEVHWGEMCGPCPGKFPYDQDCSVDRKTLARQRLTSAKEARVLGRMAQKTRRQWRIEEKK